MKLAAILLLALALRLISINQSFWLDEATSITVARDFSFSQILTNFSPGDFHPPLYYMMLKVWVSLFGISEVSARLLSVVFGLGTIALVYKIGERLVSSTAGYMAALLLATAPLHIYYSQETRMYVPLTFFVTLAIFGFIRKRWILFALSLIAIGATDYMGLLILPVFWIAGLIARKKLPWRSFIFAHIPLVLVALSWLPAFSQQLAGGLGVKDTAWGAILGGSSIKDIGLVVVKFIIGRISFAQKYIYAAIVLISGAFIGFGLLRSLQQAKKLTVLWLWLILPIGIATVISVKIPVLSYFRVLYCLPALYLLIASALSIKGVSKIVFTIILIFNTVFSLNYLFHDKFHRENWRGMVNFITQNSPQNSRTVFVSNSQMEAYRFYAPDHDIAGGKEAVDASFRTLWLMRYVYDLFDPEDLVRKKVEDLGYTKVSEYNFNGIVVYKYENMY